MHDAGEPPGRRRLARHVDEEVNETVIADFGAHEQRRLALGDWLEALGVLEQPRREGRNLLRILEEELQPVARRRGREQLDDLGQRRRKHLDRHESGSSSRSIGTRTLLPHSVHDPS